MSDSDFESPVDKQLFGGDVLARTDENHFFPEITILPNSEDRPAIVLPDGHIFLETFSKFYKEAVEFISAIAEPCSRPKYMEEYQISPNSIFAGTSFGLTSKKIIDILSMISKTALTDEFKKNIEYCCKTIGKVNLVLRKQRYYIESAEISILRKFSSIDFFKIRMEEPSKDEKLYENTRFIIVQPNEVESNIESIKALTQSMKGGEDTLEMDDKDDEAPLVLRFGVKKEAINEIREYCFSKNIFLTEEYDFENDPLLPPLFLSNSDKLKPTTTLRPYQEKALKKMFSGGRAKSCIIVLPCGAGKTLVGITAIATINKPAVIVCNSNIPVQQWHDQLLQYTSIDKKLIIKLTGEDKLQLPEGPCVLITTYGSLTSEGNKSKETLQILEQIHTRDWGILVLDEVQGAAAKKFRNATKIVRAHARLGLTATLVREDEKVEDLKYLVGPKLYEANWIELAEQGYLARVKCYELLVPMTAEFYRQYLAETDARKRLILASANPNKIQMLESLIQHHELKGDKILVFCDALAILVPLANKIGKVALYGETPNDVRQMIFTQFKSGNKVNTVILSSIGNIGIDLPAANVLIEISSQSGGRMQLAQRLGRVLRPKPGRNGEFNSFFYSIVSEDTVDMYFTAKRQQYLIDQGYSYEPVTNPEKMWPAKKERKLDSKEAQKEWLQTIMGLKEMSENSELSDSSQMAEEGDTVSTVKTSSLTGASVPFTFVNIV